jgi:uridine kinase
MVRTQPLAKGGVMKERSGGEVINLVVGELLESFRIDPERAMMVGVAGKVASGKSRFTAKFCKTLSSVLSGEVVYLPFDLWIDRQNLNAPSYHDRFLLGEFGTALESISSGSLWFCPRHDLMKHGFNGAHTRLNYESLEVSWHHRSFRKVSSLHELADLGGASGVYADADTQQLYSLFLPKRNVAYVTDGTLVFWPEEIKRYYHRRIFIASSWPERVARMIRRFNRHEVFGRTNETEREYVGFLVSEAKQCADDEIGQQLDDSMIVVKSSVETISNLLDLHHLRGELVSNGDCAAAYALSLEEVDAALETAREHLASIVMPEPLSLLREELSHLIESKHLLSVEGVDKVLSQLTALLLR